jgi:hypothetical protein
MGQAKVCMEICDKFGSKRKVDKNNATEISQSVHCCYSECLMNNFGFLRNGMFDDEKAKQSLEKMDVTKRVSRMKICRKMKRIIEENLSFLVVERGEQEKL